MFCNSAKFVQFIVPPIQMNRVACFPFRAEQAKCIKKYKYKELQSSTERGVRAAEIVQGSGSCFNAANSSFTLGISFDA